MFGVIIFSNSIIHLINALIVFWLIILIWSTPVLKNNNLSKYKHIMAFFVAMLFVSHPLATQSVTYIVQRLASIVSLFYMLSIAFYTSGLIEIIGIVKYVWFGGALISAVLAFMSKENAFTLPIAILLLNSVFYRQER